MANWGSTPQGLLDTVLNKLQEPKDYRAFASVCRHWREACKQHHDLQRAKAGRKHWMLPMLMVPTEKFDPGKRGLYSISEGRLDFNIQLSVPFNYRSCGFSYGWLAFMAADGESLILINPFRTGSKPITTPPLENIPKNVPISRRHHCIVVKAVLTADPLSNPNDYAIVVIYYSRKWLAFYKPDTNRWTYLDLSVFGFVDAVVYRGLVYAVLHKQESITFNVNDASAPGSHRAVGLLFEEGPCLQYLVETSRGELLEVIRYRKRTTAPGIRTTGFKVYMLILDETTGRLANKVEVKELGSDAIFISANTSFAVAVEGGKGNAIYFTNDCADSGRIDLEYHIGVFRLEDQSISDLYKPDCIPETGVPPALWVQPPLF